MRTDAGVNVLIKQIDQRSPKASTPMAVIMITNRADVLDPGRGYGAPRSA